MKKQLISVIICTYNRSSSLACVLGGLATQETGSFFDYEVLVVDNNSDDDTRAAVERFMPRFNSGLRYIFEQRQGKSYALNAGIAKASGSILAFTDDDVLLDKRWLLNLWLCFERHRCDAVGGRILPLFPRTTPNWIRKYSHTLSGPLGIHDYGGDTCPYDRSRMAPFAGANIALKAGILSGGEWFRCDFGTGNLPPGEDTELFKRLQLMGKTIYYCGNAAVFHRTLPRKMRFGFISAWAVQSGRSIVRRGYRKTGVFYFRIPRWLIRRLMEDLVNLAASFFRRDDNPMRKWILLCVAVGEIIETRNMRYEPPAPSSPVPRPLTCTAPVQLSQMDNSWKRRASEKSTSREYAHLS